jgi:hypothetical protein
MAARLEWDRRWLMLGPWRLGEVEPTPAGWVPIVSRWPARGDKRMTPRVGERRAGMSTKKHAEWQAAECERLQRALATAEKERDAAVADNAAQRGDLAGLHVVLERTANSLWSSRRRDRLVAETEARVALTDPHPGAALLEQHRKELVRARNEGLERAATHLVSEAARYRTRATELAGKGARHGHDAVAHAADTLDVASERVRALKESEKCGSPRLSDDYVRGVRAAIQVAKEEGSAEIAGCIADLLEPEE